MDYEKHEKRSFLLEVISADANADLLANVPHDRMEDLAVVYRFVMESSEDGRASILVTNNLMDRMGVPMNSSGQMLWRIHRRSDQ